MTVARCPVCRSTHIVITRNGDGLLVATCYGCGNVTQPARTSAEVDDRLRWIPLAELPAHPVVIKGVIP